MGSLCFFILVLLSLSGVAEVIGEDGYSRLDFPPDFIFGSATSAYQVEGAANEDGRTPSIWDTFSHSGNVAEGNGDIACDEYHKYKEDVQLMADIGLDAYRFSISWSRLIPNGRGPINPKGLQYYKNLINELIDHGIQPHVTLHHYDLPQSLDDEYGGWVSPNIVEDFTFYADVCFREFGDKVLHWTTLNEPNVFSLGGYDSGMSPPQRCSAPFSLFNCSRGNSSTEPYLAAHYALLSHASAARLYRKKYKYKQHGFIGISIYTFWPVPLTDTKEDFAATQRAKDFFMGWFLNPVVYGDYPDTMKKIVGSRLPQFTKSERSLVKGSCDFIGVIHYSISYIKDDSASLMIENRDFILDVGAQFITNITDFIEFSIMPWGMQEVLEYMKQDYGNPSIYILENGQSMLRNATLEDISRVNYLDAYIGAVLDAVRNGSDTRGYFQWSLLDVYELLTGYTTGFGLIYVDLDDPELKRTPKLSAYWYSNFLKGKIVDLDEIIEVYKNHSIASRAASFC